MAVLDAGGGERVIQPPFDPASAAMEPGEAAVGMSQGAQGRRDAPDRRQMRIGEGAVSVRAASAQVSRVKTSSSSSGLRVAMPPCGSISVAHSLSSAFCAGPTRSEKPLSERPA